MGTWSLVDELCNRAQCEDLALAVSRLGLLTSDALDRLTVDRDWWSAGAETYCFVFTVHGLTGASRRFILKAFVPTPGTYSVSEALDTTMRRAEYLESQGVPVPHCYGGWSGTALFDYIPYDFTACFRDSHLTPEERLRLRSELILTSEGIGDAGFKPVDLIRDLRTDGDRVYLVDFGWDLGDAVQSRDSKRYVLDIAYAWLVNWDNHHVAVEEGGSGQ